MTEYLDIRAHDALFASRTTAEDWARIVAFRDRPAFLDGVRRHEGTMQPFFAHNLILNRVVTEVWRFQMLVITLYLHDTRDALDPRTGLTVTNLQKSCARLKLASPGRVYAFLNIMKLGGYLSAVRSPIDSRVVHLEPTARFMATVEQWNDQIFASIDSAAPEGALLALRARHPELGRYMRTSGAEGLLDGWDALGPFPEVLHFASTDGGWLMMENLVLRSMHTESRACIEPVSLNMRATAKQFGGSRSNLIRTLESGYHLGLLDAPPRGGSHILPSSRMTCAFLAFMASFLGYFQHHTRIALARITGSP
ncbi:hypothetical protein NDN01_25295 [Sphingomonas sp. QA11]|uniref:hypothetical protein n=1 Tax=Sphingomonas sp. QA11 TaxID=2950605 RepID=UPI00234AFD74|nr:hypothetical protein [Sphingomonas sp. QA11]WCM27258.1 hypothetical protein NDN01_25295 [Sphingomonas sp. QA11]